MAWGGQRTSSRRAGDDSTDLISAMTKTPKLPGFMAAAYATPDSYFVKATGTPDLHDYRVHFYEDKQGNHVPVSPWHDVPLRSKSGAYNFICEIPKWSRKKFEIDTGGGKNPIKQDKDKKGNLRSYVWGDMMFNYGAFPQTWEDPDEVSHHTNHKGDDDPLDVIELSGRCFDTGAIVEVKVLGIIAMIDDGETDWKVIAIHTKDPLAPLLNDVQDVHKHCHGAIPAIVAWLRHYKSHKGVTNKFAFDGECKDKAFAEEIIEECHAFWKRHPHVVEKRASEQASQRIAGVKTPSDELVELEDLGA